MTEDLVRSLGEELAHGSRLWLFLDYDGTLADFAPTPDTILPDPELIALIARLAKLSDQLRLVVMSGRRFSHIQALLPVPGILEAGTYGIEYKNWEGELVCLIDFKTERPFIDQVKTQWAALIDGRQGYYLEDKGYSLALHARLAPENEARATIAEAARLARQVVAKGAFHILSGSKFIEVAPTIADKGQSVGTLLKRFPWPAAHIVYIGDDDKDEAAFQVVRAHDGIPILVAEQPRPTTALLRLANPQAVRGWLTALADALEHSQVSLPRHPVEPPD